MDGPTIVLSLLVLASCFTVYTFLKLVYLERMAKIEKGIDLENSNGNFLGLKIGMLFIGISLGLLISYLISEIFIVNDDVIFPAFTFLLGGLSLVASHFWVQQLKKK